MTGSPDDISFSSKLLNKILTIVSILLIINEQTTSHFGNQWSFL